MRATIRNLASRTRRQWVDIAFPKALVDATNSRTFLFGPRNWPAVRGIDIGPTSTLIHVLAELAGNSHVDGNLVPRNFRMAFAPSEWVTDDLQSVVPLPLVRKNGQDLTVGPLTMELVESSVARAVWHMRGRIEGTMLVWDAWAYFYSMQDVVPVELTLTCSDPRVYDIEEHIDGVFVTSGEYLHIDYRTRLGQPVPFRFGSWHQSLSGPRVIGDGEQLAFTGAILALPSTAETGPWWNTELRLDTLVAQSEAPMLGASWNWGGRWLAFGTTAETPPGTPSLTPPGPFRAWLQAPGDIYDPRPIGLAKDPGQTGGQEDFGASKGSVAASNHDPHWIYEARFSMTEHLRPFHNREADGTPVLASNHPLWVTWSQVTIPAWSHDRLGKHLEGDFYPEHDGSGYRGEDDQHRSQNNFNALYALTGSHALKSVLFDFLQADLAQIKGRAGAPRAMGRLLQAWAGMLCVLDGADATDLVQHMRERMNTIENSWPGKTLNPKPIRALEYIVDGRALRDQNGTPVPAWVVWEHSIATMGFFAAWKVTGEQRYLTMSRIISELVTRYGCFEEGGIWHACTAVRYLTGAGEGDALPQQSYRLGSPDLNVDNTFWTWILPAVKIARALEPELAPRADAIVACVAQGGARTWNESEWWAV